MARLFNETRPAPVLALAATTQGELTTETDVLIEIGAGYLNEMRLALGKLLEGEEPNIQQLDILEERLGNALRRRLEAAVAANDEPAAQRLVELLNEE